MKTKLERVVSSVKRPPHINWQCLEFYLLDNRFENINFYWRYDVANEKTWACDDKCLNGYQVTSLSRQENLEPRCKIRLEERLHKHLFTVKLSSTINNSWCSKRCLVEVEEKFQGQGKYFHCIMAIFLWKTFSNPTFFNSDNRLINIGKFFNDND